MALLLKTQMTRHQTHSVLTVSYELMWHGKFITKFQQRNYAPSYCPSKSDVRRLFGKLEKIAISEYSNDNSLCSYFMACWPNAQRNYWCSIHRRKRSAKQIAHKLSARTASVSSNESMSTKNLYVLRRDGVSRPAHIVAAPGANAPTTEGNGVQHDQPRLVSHAAE